MTSRDFVYWLQGYFEISGSSVLDEKQTTIIRNHLNMVFKHEIDPSHGDAAHQAALSAAHGGGGTAQPPKSPLEGLLREGLLIGADSLGPQTAINC